MCLANLSMHPCMDGGREGGREDNFSIEEEYDFIHKSINKSPFLSRVCSDHAKDDQ